METQQQIVDQQRAQYSVLLNNLKDCIAQYESGLINAGELHHQLELYTKALGDTLINIAGLLFHKGLK